LAWIDISEIEERGSITQVEDERFTDFSLWGCRLLLGKMVVRKQELIVSTLADTGCTYHRNMSILIISFSIIVYEQAAHANIGYDGGILLLRGGGWDLGLVVIISNLQ
jgi:hypothetical protein